MPPRHFQQCLRRLGYFKIDGFGAKFGGKLKAFGKMVDGDDPLGAEQKGRLDRKQPNRSAAPHRNCISRFDVAIFGSHPPGRKNVRQEQNLIVLNAIGNDDRPDIGKRHAHIFGLSPRIAAGHMAVSEKTGHRMPIRLFRDILIVGRVAVVACRILFLAAVKATAAGNCKGNDHSLTFLQGAAGANLHYFAHELVAQNIAGFH